MHTLLRFAGTVGAVIVTVNLVPGISLAGGWVTILLVALVWSVVVGVVRPVLHVLTLPITLLTFGLFSLILNAFLFYAVTWVVPGFEVAGFFPALLGALALSVFGWLISRVL